ncbi:TPA: hypothetical protein ONA26_003171 [Pseudomonas aeruginosa]|nr:hypothetical protein [Pseudomonas aeruginosa]
MTINLTKLKALAEAAKRDPYDHLAANDYGMSMPPATALELIAEVEHHRLVEAEGCKPEISNRPIGGHTSDALAMHGLDKGEGWRPDLIKRLTQAMTALIPYAEDEAANSYCKENAHKAWTAVDFARALMEEVESKKSYAGDHA